MPVSRLLALIAVVAFTLASSAEAQPTLARDRAGKMPDSIRPFVDQLYSPDPRQRAEGACQLGERPVTAIVAIPILVSMLGDDTIVPAIECEMSPWLRRELQVSADARRWAETSPAKEAADALGEIGDAAVPSLLQALRHANWKTRKYAAHALGETDRITEVGTAVSALVATLGDDHAEVRDRTAWALGELEEPAAVPALVRALGDGDAAVRAKAAWALGEIEDPSAVSGLTAALKDGDLDLRRMAVWALGEIEDASAVPVLLVALKDDDAEVRSKTAWALGEIEDAAAVPGLVQALNDPQWQVRKMAAWALGEIDDVSAIAPLQAARYDTNVAVRQAVMHALRELRDQE
jgi:HEAT repeat protein